MNDRTFVGGGRIIGQFGNIKINVKVKELVANDKGYVNLIIAKMKQVDRHGNTHTVYLDDYKKPIPKEEDLQF